MQAMVQWFKGEETKREDENTRERKQTCDTRMENERRVRSARPMSSSGRPLMQVSKDIVQFGSLRYFRHFTMETRSNQELVITIVEPALEVSSEATPSCFLFTALTRYNWPLVWKIRKPTDPAGRAATRAMSSSPSSDNNTATSSSKRNHNNDDAPVPLDAIRDWKRKKTRVWDVVQELIVQSRRQAGIIADDAFATSSSFDENDYAFKVDTASLLHLEQQENITSELPSSAQEIAFIAAGGLLSFLRYALETRVIPLTAAVVRDVEVLADMHVRGIRRLHSILPPPDMDSHHDDNQDAAL